ncbi:MAG: hypothetical protein WB870_09580 [Gallionellaceae bacterium]
MRRMSFGLLLAGLVVAAHAAQPEDSSVSPRNLLKIQSVRSNIDQLPPYRFSTSVEFTTLADTVPVGLGLTSTFPHPVADLKNEALWTSSARWQPISISPDGHASLSPLLLNESKGEQVAIKPQHHSVFMLWHKAFL